MAKAVLEIASLPVQEERRGLWRSLNGLSPKRPLVMIEQVCWHEIDDDSLRPRCENDELRNFEIWFRRMLYQWKHFPGDMVVEPFVFVQKAIHNTGFGIQPQDKTLASDTDNPVVSHKWIDVLQNDDDLEKITVPKVSLDIGETARRLDAAHDIFDGILEIRSVGWPPFMQLWDPLSSFKGVENALYALADEPEFMHRLVSKMLRSFTSMLNQLEEQGLLCDARSQTSVHCTGAYTGELPAEGYDPQKPRCKDLWIAGLAQMLGVVSGPMYQEFELDYVNPVFERFGLVYYGCCDPLDRKLDIVTKIPNLRKVSMSPWTQPERGAEGLGKRFVFSCKPNPAHLAPVSFDEALVRKELLAVKSACDRNGCPLEFILKDISTVHYDPKRLERWYEIAMDISMS